MTVEEEVGRVRHDGDDYLAGFEGAQEGVTLESNPYPSGTMQHQHWASGWQEAVDKNMNHRFVQEAVDDPPDWSQQRILDWEAVFTHEKSAFVTHECWTDSASVNVFQIVGTKHEQYQGKTWLGLLTSGKRMQHNLACLSRNPDYYIHDVDRRPGIYYLTMDGVDFYVGADGNHRTCLARFFLHRVNRTHLKNVTVNHHKVDEAFHALYMDIRQFVRDHRMAVSVEPYRELLRREDGSGWKVDCYQLFIRWRDISAGEEDVLDFHQAKKRFDTLKQEFSLASETSKRTVGRRLRDLFK